MPKRPVTPPIDDEAKYLTVFYPYPSRPNMELDSHRKLFVRWVAACIGAEYLRAFYHKPTSPGCLIMEVEESLSDFSQILGAHQWSLFLAAPQVDDVRHASKVFYCTYNSDRLVQKNGWKRIDVKDSWFRSKGPSLFVCPYPPTHWCDIPKVGNVIQNELCRPLPRADFPPPSTSEPALVVGSLEWQEFKRQQSARVITVKTWTRGAPPESLRTAPPPAAQPAPHQAWTSVGGPGVLRAKSSASSGGSSKSGTGTNTSSIRSVSPLAPPSSQSGSGRDSSPLSPTEGVYSGQVSVPGVDVEGALKALSLDEEDFDEDFYSLRYSASVAGDAGNAIRSAETGAPITGSLWDDYVDDDEDDDDPQDNQLDLVKAALKQPGLCREHNRVCKRGICKWYAAQLREEEKERRKMERFQQRELREMRMNNKRNASPENGSSPPSRSSSPPPARRPPPHLRAGPPAPTLGPPRQLPPHLRRGAAPASAPVASPPSPISPPVHISPTPSKKSGDDDRSVSSSGSRAALSKPTTADPSTVPSSVPAPSRPWGTWGRAPSITASSVQRNNESWSVSARGIDDVQSVAGRSEASGQGAKATREGPWGNTDAVRSAASQGARTNRTYARSVAGSVASASTARTWGNVSAGPW